MAKISTADCVAAIVDYYLDQNGTSELTEPKNWKRLSKSGTGTVRRIFENKKTGDVVHVFSTETEIIEVSESGKLKDFGQFAAKPKNAKKDKYTLFSCSKPTDIIVMGNYNDDHHDVKITDDESSFSLTVNGTVIAEYAQADGFVTICTLQDFLKNLPQLESYGDGEKGESLFETQPISDFFLVKGYVGNVNLRLLDDNGDYVDDGKVAAYVKKNEWLLWDNSLREVVIDLEQACDPIKIDEDLLSELKVRKHNLGLK